MNTQTEIKPSLEWISELAANDFHVECEFEDLGETIYDADIGGIDGWAPDNIITSASLEVWDREGDSYVFDMGRAELVQVLGLHAVRNLERAENERALSA